MDVAAQVAEFVLSGEAWHPLAEVVQTCAAAVLRVLDGSHESLDRVIRASTDIVRVQCEERFYVYTYTDVPEHWRALHSDAILVACAATVLMAGRKHVAPDTLTRRIADLDRALVISGAPNREPFVHALLTHLQDMLRVPQAKRRRTHAAAADTLHIPLTLVSAAQTIPTYDHAPSLSTFYTHCPGMNTPHGRPFIIRGFASAWPALTRWRDPIYLRDRAGPARIVPVETGARYTDAAWGQAMIPWAQFLDRIAWGKDEAGEALYLAQHTLHKQFPWLAEDVLVPDYVYACPPREGGDIEPIVSAWLGPASTVSPAHTDPYYNCYVQVVGHKHVWLAPPSTPSMQAYTSDDADMFAHLMGNTSRVDVMSPTLPPAFVRDVVPLAEQAELHPGDLLFLPPMWWHAMCSTSKVSLISSFTPPPSQSFSVSFWF